ncbi:Na(+)/H(+) antiporter subunit B [Pyruvatibacter sp.]|uniref:Na(+)/H(+) antiporter subunit B n=1 Tax=unclassified Pyruvatibacter TaxID=2618840 RepID=UPI002968A07A|nr:Na(+)/H(+) antiporter subunit B [Alphaproteobacteria bacterium]
MNHHIVLRVITKILIAPIILFGLYVQFHGDFGAGGGFQAGVIVAVGFILYALIFGLRTTQQVMPLWVVRTAACFGVLIYAGVGVYTMLRGGNFLDYDYVAADPIGYAVAGQHLGILLIEAGVGLTVAAVMVLVFYGFADAAGPIDDKDW